MRLCVIGKAHSAHTAITGNFIEFRIPEFVFDFCKLSPRQLPFPQILREKITLKECCCFRMHVIFLVLRKGRGSTYRPDQCLVYAQIKSNTHECEIQFLEHLSSLLTIFMLKFNVNHTQTYKKADVPLVVSV